MSLGPATETISPGGPSSNPYVVGRATEAPPEKHEIVEDLATQELGALWDDNPIAAVPEVDPPKEVDPKLVRTQQLVQDVNDFMRANDVHRFWRRHLGQKVHRHVGYAGWPKKVQTEFDARFKGFLSDPQFVTSVCRKVMDMEMGHALGAKWVAGLLVVTAGFTAFALCGLDG